MRTAPDLRGLRRLAAGLALVSLVSGGCREPALAEPGRPFDDRRTSLKGGTVSRRDAELAEAYRRAALAGDREAQTLYALMLQTGQGVPRNEAESARLFRVAAEAGECAAQYHLGLLHLQGRGVRIDIERAAFWLRRAADHRIETQQSSFQMLYRSFLGLDQRTPAPALAASSGAPSEVEHARRAAARDALYERGNAYLKGHGVPMDPAHAVRFFRMAANEGLEAAQLELGIAYRDGRGARYDPVLAHMWFNIAASTGSARAREELGALGRTLSSEEIARAEFMAAEWAARRR